MVGSADLHRDLDAGAFLERVIARGNERQAALVLADRFLVAALQIEDVAEPGVRADDLQTGIA